MKRDRALLRNLVLIALLFAGWTRQAQAEMTYNYDQRWVLDSETGLYWQLNWIPAATFTPSQGTIADIPQLKTLFEHVGVSDAFDQLSLPPKPYSLSLANLLSFFASNQAAQPSNRQSNLTL